MSASDIRAEVASLGEYFRGDHYHLVLRNCNHFSDALVERLTQPRRVASRFERCAVTVVVDVRAQRRGVIPGIFCMYVD